MDCAPTNLFVSSLSPGPTPARLVFDLRLRSMAFPWSSASSGPEPRTPAFAALVDSCRTVDFRAHACIPLGVLMFLPSAEVAIAIALGLLYHPGRPTILQRVPRAPVNLPPPVTAWPEMDSDAVYVHKEFEMDTKPFIGEAPIQELAIGTLQAIVQL
ncbi:hypothetical protein B0H16DRAFT_1474306 [Mycena metata]|uniref:Uncharacterized protein n=1 Tax=Mycena metata TaxID=1033252 RepID=A0AAD7HIG5_9AGAR|nr:hypothetical protein B0H16DRAFT_1474306 [Mycena metata]